MFEMIHLSKLTVPGHTPEGGSKDSLSDAFQ